MASPRDELLDGLLKLPVDDRAYAARELLSSLDGEEESDVDEAWAVEIERRLRELDEGGVQPEEWPGVRDRILSHLRTLRR